MNSDDLKASFRYFHLGDILSITTGFLLSPRRIEGIYDILNYMTGDNLFTHQLPRAAAECKPFLLQQHPQLAAIDASTITRENWDLWMSDQIGRFGEKLPVSRLPAHAHEFIDPMSELAEKVHPDRIITVKP